MPVNPLTDPNWAADAADTVERIVGNVRSRAVTPVVHAARGVVFGLLAVFLGMAAILLLLLVAARGLQALLDLVVSHSQAVYLSYLIIGGVLCIVGLVLMKMRAPTDLPQ